MANLFLMGGGASGEAVYDTLSKTTGAGQAQAWNNTPALNGIAGDVTYTVANTNNAFATKEGLDFTSATSLRVTGWIDASGMTFTANALFGMCVVSLPDAAVDKHRVGMSYQYTLTGNVHQLFFQKVDDGGANSRNNSVTVTLAPHKFDIVLVKASSAVAGDGQVHYYVDDDLKASRTDLDIYDDFAGLQWLQIGNCGKMSGFDAGATGPIHIGKIGINDTGDPIEFPPEYAYPNILNHSLGLHF